MQSEAQLIVAHRGASADAPENTIAAFRLAWEQGADAAEGDFHLTRDSQVVCSHDPTTKRLSGVDLRISDSTLDELQKIDVGSWKDPSFRHERMPTLSDVLAARPPDKKFYIEIKCESHIVPFLQRILQGSNSPPEHTVFISFNENVIRSIKTRLPQYKAYWLVGFDQNKQDEKWYPPMEHVVATAKRLGADGVDLNANMEVMTPRAIQLCRQAGLSVHAWTVDDLDTARVLQELGVDSITTNRPGELRQGLLKGRVHAAQRPNAPRAKGASH
ncbi:MAG: glycerophosphodiester phosphodiesterase [Planctomycetales bacterium]|nr:glycerophosphodiester phosphodiesterase [Planctomycetales bacterium]